MLNQTLPLFLPVHPKARVDVAKQLIAIDVFTANHAPLAAHVVLMSRADAWQLCLSLGVAIREFDAAALERAKVIRLPRKQKKG